jgi:streptogramin lyase
MNARRTLIALIAMLLTVLAVPSTGVAAPALNGTFSVSGTPGHVTEGPDGNVWFTLSGSSLNHEFGKIDPNGTVTEYDTPTPGLGVVGITTGPDNKIWMTANAKLVKVDPANPAAAQELPNADITDPRGITKGSDGNLWAGSGDQAIKINPATGATITKFTVAGMSARGADLGPDGNVWIVDFGGRIVRVTPTGATTAFTVGGGPQEIASGPDQLAFGNPGAVPQTVGRISLTGVVSPTPDPAADPFGVTYGLDGAFWFAQFAGNNLGRLSSTGELTTLGGFAAASGPRYITKGAGGTLWVSLETAKKIARVSGLEAPTPPSTGGGGGTTPTTTTITPPPVPPVDTSVPQVSDVLVKPDRFIAGPTPTAVAAAKKKPARGPVGTTISFMVTKDATATLSIEQALPGRKTRTSCRRPTRANPKAKKCTRYKVRGTLTRTALKGQNAVPFSGRIGQKRLPPGKYRVGVSATDSLGQSGLPQYASFTILAPGKAKGKR